MSKSECTAGSAKLEMKTEMKNVVFLHFLVIWIILIGSLGMFVVSQIRNYLIDIVACSHMSISAFFRETSRQAPPQAKPHNNAQSIPSQSPSNNSHQCHK